MRNTILLALFASTLFVSIAIRAIEPTDIQIDKISTEQLRQAAEAGDPDAQYALGYMYYYGKRVAEDKQQATQWIKRASVQGQEQAIRALAIMQPGQAQAVAPTVENATPSTSPPAAPSTVNTNNIPISSNGVLKSDEQHLLSLPSNYYTVQLLGASGETEILSYIDKHHLSGKVIYYRGDRDGKDWYVVLYGTYPTAAEANAAIPNLPAEVRNQKPWVKLLSLVQENIKKQQKRV